MDKYTQYAKAFNSNNDVIYWIENVLAKHLIKNPENQSEIEHIIDYLSYPRTTELLDIKGMSYESAKKNTGKWSKALSKKGRGIKEKPEDTEVVLDFEDGFKIVKLVGKNAFEREGAIMGHCVASYYGKEKEIYSLRDKNNVPHCTMEKDQQIKGRGNGDIHPQYVHYVVKFLEHTGMTVGDSEMKHLGYVNIESVKYEIDTSECYNEVYFPKNKPVLDKNGNEYHNITLWNMFGLVNLDKYFGVSFKFDISKSVETFLSKTKETTAVANAHYSTAVANERYSTAVANERYSTAVANRRYSTAVANRSYSTAVANERYSTAVANESYSTAVANSHSSTAVANESYSTAVANERYSTAVANAHYSTAVANRSYSTAVANSHYSTAVANSDKSVVFVSHSYKSKAKAKIGSAIFLTERDSDWNITHVFAGIVDNKKIKEEVFYTLKNGKLVEYSEDLWN